MENIFLSALAGYAVAQLPPVHDRSKGYASALVLGCIDPRFTADLAHYLTHNYKLHADYDLYILAGAEAGVFHSTCWRESFFEHIDIAIKLHGITEIWCASHMDCGMYKIAFNLEQDDNENLHLEKLRELKALLLEKYPNLGFKGILISANGIVRTLNI